MVAPNNGTATEPFEAEATKGRKRTAITVIATKRRQMKRRDFNTKKIAE